MKIFQVIFAFILLLVSVSLSINQHSFAGEIHFLHSKGFGPVLIGMTPSIASSVLGLPIRPADALDEDDVHCHYEFSEGNYEHMGFMVQEGIITRIDVFGKEYKTDTGIIVGLNEKIIFEKYGGNVSEKIHPYLGLDGKYILVDNADGYRMIFETVKGVITRFRTGIAPSVDYIEGCQ